MAAIGSDIFLRMARYGTSLASRHSHHGIVGSYEAGAWAMELKRKIGKAPDI
ncbi:hypothetical protein ACFSQT_09860 [Mesorhizobium calcicola]|uniref:Uncharacterized protein n=1 Tax=Mesorhizobium calcicola TaxID=1300310 RepID=A0ABW4WCR5_9HYPH